MNIQIFNGNEIECTLVCIYNSEKLYTDLIANLETQKNINFQLISIDNINNSIKGARKAFNKITNEILGEYVFFIHQDIRFLNENALSNVINSSKKLVNLGIVGIAGCDKSGEVYSTIIHGKEKKKPGKYIDNYIEVQTVDECFFGMKLTIFKKYPFNNYDGWHLYGVEQCLKYSQLGLINYVINSDIWHLSSGGSLNYEYFIYLKKIIRDYPSLYSINTTVYNWPTKGFKSSLIINYYLCKLYLRKKIRGR